MLNGEIVEIFSFNNECDELYNLIVMLAKLVSLAVTFTLNELDVCELPLVGVGETNCARGIVESTLNVLLVVKLLFPEVSFA